MSMFALPMTIIAIACLVMVRNELVFRAKQRRINEIHEKNMSEIGRSDFIAVMGRRYAELELPSYEAMLFDLTRWTYRQFYPRCVE